MIVADPLVYVQGAIQRLMGMGLASDNGSHVAGVYNKAAKAFEGRLKSFASEVTGRTDLGRRPLGVVIQSLNEEASAAGDERLRTIINSAGVANDAWVKLKHGADPPVDELLEGLHAMERVLRMLG
ncbi:MAG: hypothetical protein U0807_01565 [Candidatus Binatia bacterium]